MAETLTLLPTFLKPIDDIFLKTIQTTRIQPAKFRKPNFEVPEEFIPLPVPYPIPYPPPDGPFRIKMQHPFFGPIESPILTFGFVEEKVRQKQSRNSKRRASKRKGKKEQKETTRSTSQELQTINSEIIDLHKSKFVEEYRKKTTEHWLNQYLIYFKCVEKSVNLKLEKSAGPSQSSSTMKDLHSLTKLLGELVERVENFWEENHESLSELENSAQFKDILSSVSRLQHVLDELNASNISEILWQNIDKKEEHMLCSILGLEDEIADYILGLDPEVRNHKTDQHWILQFFDQKEEYIDISQDINTSLKVLGFTTSKARHLAEKLTTNDSTDHQNITYWAKLYIEQQFSYHILLASRGGDHCSKNEPFDTGYFIETKTDEDEEQVKIPAVNTRMLNEDEFSTSQWLHDYLIQECNALDGTTYWFHGTDHKSAINILQHGIDLERGKQGGDFSDGNGFYLTSDYKFAHLWPQKMMKKPNSAVIVFKLKSDVFANRKGIQFCDATKEWQNTVGFFRNGKDYKWVNGRKRGKELTASNFILGPISQDGKDKNLTNWFPRARKPMIFELCLKDELLADDFYDMGNNIHQTIFFY